MRRQVGRVVAAVAVVVAVVGGCGGPNQAGSAVIVGSEAVPLEKVQQRLDTVLQRTELVAQITEQGGGPADIARDIVTREVLHGLLEDQAADSGIVVTDADVDASIEEQGGIDALLQTTFSDPDGLRERVRDGLVAVALAQRTVQGLSVTADLAAAASLEEAQGLAQVLAAGGPEAEALFAANPETSAQATVYDAVTQPEIAGTVLFGTPVGSTVLFQPDPAQASWIVFRVLDRATDGPADPEAVAQISQEQLVEIGERTLQQVADEAGIRVNPRYGVWDPIRLRVVPADQTAGEIFPPSPGVG